MAITPLLSRHTITCSCAWDFHSFHLRGLPDLRSAKWFWETMRNTRHGRIFILGIGPSLIHQVPLLEGLKGEATFGCNYLMEWKDIPFVPTYYSVTDEHPIKAYKWTYPEYDMFRIYGSKDPCLHPLWHWWPMYSDRHRIENEGMVSFGDWECLKTGWCCPITNLDIAAWLGYTEFYMLGLDTTPVGYAYNPTEVRKAFPRMFGGIQRSMRRARQNIEANGGRIYDCTPAGWLNETYLWPRENRVEVPWNWVPVLEYKSLEEVLNAKARPPREPPHAGEEASLGAKEKG